jgi:hypothetical protein
MASPSPENQPAEVHPAVLHLEQAVRDFIQLGASSHLSIEPTDVIAVLERVYQGKTAAADPVSPEDFFLEALEEEIIQLRANTYEKVELKDGSTEMAPLTDATWSTCLKLMIQRFKAESV